MGRIVSLSLFTFLVTVVFAQKTDTLLLLAVSAKADTAAISLYLKVASTTEQNNPTRALEYSRKAEQLSKKLDAREGELKAVRSIARSFSILGEFDSTLFYYERSLEIARQMNDALQIGVSLSNVGAAHRYLSDYELAINYSLQAVKILASAADRPTLAKVMNGLQLNYYYLPDYDSAVAYGEKSVQLARELKDTTLLIMALSNLSMPYKDKKQLEKSKSILMETLQLAEGRNDLYAESGILTNLAGVFLEQGDYLSLREYAKKSLLLHRKIGSKDGECISLRGLAISYLQTKSYSLAKIYADSAYQLADNNNYKSEKASCLKTLSNIYYAMGDVKAGEKFYNLSDDAFEDLFKEAHLESAAKYAKKYESEKKDVQIKLQAAQLKNKNTLNYILIGSAASILIISLLSYRTYQHKQKFQFHRIAQLEKEKQLMASEAVIKGQDEERGRLAKDLHDGLGGLLSGVKFSLTNMKTNVILDADNALVFERSLDMLDHSISELRRVAHNMMPEVLVKFGLSEALKSYCARLMEAQLFKVDFQYIGNEERLPSNTEIFIYRVVQELLTNIAKHARATHVLVQLARQSEEMSITVEDDGVGFDTSVLEKSKGAGWANIKSRVTYLKGKLDIQSSRQQGTSVHITFSVL